MNIVACKASFRKSSNCHNPPLYWLSIEAVWCIHFYLFEFCVWRVYYYLLNLVNPLDAFTDTCDIFFFVQSQLHIFQVFHYLIGKKIFEKLFEWNLNFFFSMTWEWSWCEICMPHHCHYVVAASSKLETWKNKKKPQRHSLRSTFFMSFLLVFCKLLVPLNFNVVVFYKIFNLVLRVVYLAAAIKKTFSSYT